MTPRHPFVHDPRPARPGRRCPILPLAVLLGLAIAAAAARPAAAQAAPDSGAAAPAAAAVPLDTSPLVPAARRGLLRPDRVAHASFALALGTGAGLATREPAAGAATALALAVAKELLDDRLDRGDLAAGALGAGLAWIVVAALTR